MSEPLNLESTSIERLGIRLLSDGTSLFIDDSDVFPDEKTVILRPVAPTPKAAILKIAILYRPTLAEIAIFEWTEYLLEGEFLQKILLPGASVIQLTNNLYRFQLNNRIGRLRLTITSTNHNRHVIPLAVLSPKYPTPIEHLNFFQTLLSDLVERSASLPFDVAQPTEFAADESPEPPTAIFVYHFLRQYGVEIQSALETILGNPHRTLIYYDDLVPLAQATHADASVLDAILAQPQLLVRTRQSLPVTRALKGHAPTHLWQPLAEETFDTPPNRFAKQFLTELADWSARLGENKWLTRYLASLETVRDKLAFAQYDPLWPEVGLLTRFPAENQVLLKRYGYREWADLWRRFHLARLPAWRQLQEAIDARDIATLYEMWCFFALVDKIGDILGVASTERRWDLELSDEKGLAYKSQVVFGNSGYTLTYNEGFGRGERRSYSVTLRPDFTLHGPDNLRLVFDAKFRFDRSTFEMNDEPGSEDNDINVQRVAKQADLYKMHTYRDALDARAAVTLYPGDKDVFYHTNASRTARIDWPSLIKGQWAGIGAVVMEPESGQ